jgi:hypothetical protein
MDMLQPFPDLPAKIAYTNSALTGTGSRNMTIRKPN